MKPQAPDMKYRILPAGLPILIRDLSFESNRPVINPAYLFFREARPTFSVPEFTTRDCRDSVHARGAQRPTGSHRLPGDVGLPALPPDAPTR